MNYIHVYDGVKILEMNKELIIKIFNLYLKKELNKEVGNKDILLYEKFQNFYKGCMTGIIKKDETETLLKNTSILLNVLTHITTKLNLESVDLNIICKLLGNIKKIQFKVQSGEISEKTNTEISRQEQNKKDKLHKQEILKVEVNKEISEKSESIKSKSLKFSIDNNNIYKNTYDKILKSEENKQDIKNYKNEKEDILNKIEKIRETRKNKHRKSSPESTTCNSTSMDTTTIPNSSACEPISTDISKTDSESSKTIETEYKPYKKNKQYTKSYNTNRKGKRYDLMKKPLSLLNKDYYQVRSITYIYDESANKFIDKYTMFDCDKIIDDCDVYNYNLLVKSLYDRMTTTLDYLNKNLMAVEKIICKLKIKNSKISNLKSITVSEKIISNNNYVELTYGSKVYDIYYINSTMTYDEMIKRISDDLKPILEFIRLVCLNIILVCQELEIYDSYSEITDKSMYEIYKVVANDLENCC
jgi:hypothetical protein